MPEKKDVLIVDDHPLFRDGLKSLIERSADYRIVGECGSGREAIRLAGDLKPAIMTMDLSLPDMDGTEAIRQIKRQVPTVRMLILSMHSDFEYVSEGFRAGALGYVVKETTSDKLIQAMDAIGRGEYFLDGYSSQEVIGKLLAQPSGEGTPQKNYNILSPREREIMRLVAEGFSNKQIAARLDIKRKTVENHRNNLMKKLDIHNKVELTKYAVRIGLVDLG